MNKILTSNGERITGEADAPESTVECFDRSSDAHVVASLDVHDKHNRHALRIKDGVRPSAEGHVRSNEGMIDKELYDEELLNYIRSVIIEKARKQLGGALCDYMRISDKTVKLVGVHNDLDLCDEAMNHITYRFEVNAGILHGSVVSQIYAGEGDLHVYDMEELILLQQKEVNSEPFVYPPTMKTISSWIKNR